jgi:amino acid transporter
VNAKTGTPVLMTLLTGALSAVLSGLLSLKDIAELANAGTLAAFIAVGLSVIILRMRDPAGRGCSPPRCGNWWRRGRSWGACICSPACLPRPSATSCTPT